MNIADYLPFIGNPNTNLWARADKAIVDWENQHLFTVPSSVVGTGVGLINPVAGMVVSKAGVNAHSNSSSKKAKSKATHVLRHSRAKTKSRTSYTPKRKASFSRKTRRG